MRDLCGLKGSDSTCLPPLLDSAEDFVSETKAKANLLKDVFVHQNTCASLNTDAVVFGPLPLKQTFNLGKFLLQKSGMF